MLIKENKTKNATIFLTIEVSLKEIYSFKSKVYNYYRENFNFDGFRKGKASDEIIDKYFSRARIINTMAKFYISDFLKNFLAKEKIQQISFDPRVKIMNDILKEKKAVFSIEIYLMPSVELGNYKNISVSKIIEEEASDEEIEVALYELRRAYGIKKETSGPVKKGDFVTLHYKISFEDNLLAEEERDNFMIRVGYSGLPQEFENNILGLRKLEEKTFKLTFPKDYRDKKFQGLKASIWLKLLKIEVEELAELTDEFVKRISQYQNKQELTEAIRKQIKLKKREFQRKKILNEKVMRLIESSRFVVPLIFYKEEKKLILKEIQKDLENRGEDSKIWFSKNLADKKIQDALHNEAVYRVKSRLVLEELAKKENLLPSPEEITNFLNAYIKYVYNSTKEAEVHINIEAMRSLATSLLMQQKASEFLLSI